MVNTKLLVIGGVVLTVGVGAFLVHRIMNPQSTIYTRLLIPNVVLSDGNEVKLEVVLSFLLNTPATRDELHATITETAQSIATQSAKQTLAPYTLADVRENSNVQNSLLRAQIKTNMLKNGYKVTTVEVIISETK